MGVGVKIRSANSETATIIILSGHNILWITFKNDWTSI